MCALCSNITRKQGNCMEILKRWFWKWSRGMTIIVLHVKAWVLIPKCSTAIWYFTTFGIGFSWEHLPNRWLTLIPERIITRWKNSSNWIVLTVIAKALSNALPKKEKSSLTYSSLFPQTRLRIRKYFPACFFTMACWLSSEHVEIWLS